MTDLPDYHNYVVDVDVAVPGGSEPEIIPRPKGGILEKGNVTTTDTYVSLVSHVVTTDLTFQLAKIIVSCPEDIMIKLQWNSADISLEIYISGELPYVDWFPWDYYAMLGDGSKAFDILVKYPTGGIAAVCHGEIVGEEV